MTHYYLIDKDRHLAHSGTKGMKWGVRRYQNYDGTYTPEGLERYWPGSKHGTRGGAGKQRGIFGFGKKKAPLHASKKVKSNISKTTPTHYGQTPAMRAIANGAEGYNSKIDQIRALTADCDSLTSHGVWNNPTPREREACNLGLDALRALGDLDWDESRDDRQGWGTSAINWFNFEDQTVGYSLAADLINQGYTAAQVKSLRDQVDSIRWTMRNDSDDYKALHDDDDLTNVVFELAMLDNDDYIDKCYELKNKEFARNRKNVISKTPLFGDAVRDVKRAKSDEQKEHATISYLSKVKKAFEYDPEKHQGATDDDNARAIKPYLDFNDAVCGTTYDWYNSNGYSPLIKDLLQQKDRYDRLESQARSKYGYKSDKAKAYSNKSNEIQWEIWGAVLRDVGLHDSDEARKLAAHILVWD